MDNKSYLNQISAENRPVKKSKASNILSSPFTKILAIGIVVLIAIVIVGAILGNNKDNTKNKTIALGLHTKNLITTINYYQPSIKSSILRSSSAALSTILNSTKSAIDTYLTNKYELKEKDIEQKIVDSENALFVELDNSLIEAKINGLLDRTYARQMAYEISVVMNRESEIYKTIKDENLKTSLSSSYDSLGQLYDSFDSFSESK